jgi:hypothetical protein
MSSFRGDAITEDRQATGKLLSAVSLGGAIYLAVGLASALVATAVRLWDD